MCGGLYLSFEGAEKIWEKLSGHGHAEKVDEVALAGPEQEKQLTVEARSAPTSSSRPRSW